MKTSLTLHTFSWCINPTYLYVTLSIHHPHANTTEQTKQSIVMYSRMCRIHTWTVICVTFFTKTRIRCSIKLKTNKNLKQRKISNYYRDEDFQPSTCRQLNFQTEKLSGPGKKRYSYFGSHFSNDLREELINLPSPCWQF